MLETDQEFRRRWREIEKRHGQDSVEFRQMNQRQDAIDAKNQARLAEIVAQHGWPKRSVLGATATEAAFLVVQHAGRDYQLKYLPLVREAVAEKEFDPSSLAYLEDRLLTEDGRKQIYGTQVERGSDGKYTPLPIEDEARVDERRARVGLGPLAEYLAGFPYPPHQTAETTNNVEILDARDRTLRAEGKLEEAAVIERQLVELVRKTEDGTKPVLGGYLMRLAQTLNALGRYTEAEPLAREGLAIRIKHYTPDTWHVGSGKSTLGKCLLGQGRLAEAEPFLLEGYRALKTDEKNMPMEFRPRIREAAVFLVELYKAKGQPQRGIEFSRAIADHDAFYGPPK